MPRVLSVLGASVSAQTVHHQTREPTGYVEFLRRNHLNTLGVDAIVQACYPGNRLSDGGMVLAASPDVQNSAFVLIEPNVEDPSRGRIATNEEVRDVIATACAGGARPIMLMLPDSGDRCPSDAPDHGRLTSIARRFGIPVINLRLPDDFDDAYMRIEPHTTPPGGKWYARRLAPRIAAVIGDYDSGRLTFDPAALVSHIRRATAAFPADRRYRRLSLSCTGTPGKPVTIIQLQTIGPHSPVIDIQTSHGTQSVSLWDPFCHFVRQSYVTLYSGPRPPDGRIDITCTAADPDYATCRRDGQVWHAAADRHLHASGDLFAHGPGLQSINVLSIDGA
jgi:hypothetical protein